MELLFYTMQHTHLHTEHKIIIAFHNEGEKEHGTVGID